MNAKDSLVVLVQRINSHIMHNCAHYEKSMKLLYSIVSAYHKVYFQMWREV